ncbi:MAG: type III-B CRISPR module-associated protein Cmr3 [Saprospiraceae bacterium]|nr:type III-B CRISPR module-associated protein Cmr3 [Saprospiraceae bacterium]
MELTLQPLDTLFFRDGKPFARGDESWADGNFPPNPSVIYGAMRTALATVKGKEITFLEVPKKLGEKFFQIKGIYYNCGNVNYLPLPLDLVEYKTDAEGIEAQQRHKVNLLHLGHVKSILSEKKSFLKYLLHPEEFQQAENLDGGLISESQLSAYLAGTISIIDDAYKLGDFIKSEPKVGIGRNDATRSAEEGLLYRVDTKRLDKIEMRIITSDAEYSTDNVNRSVVHLGGETKLIQIKKVGRDTLEIRKPNLQKGQFKIYLCTPAFFTKHGWKPDLERIGIQATLVAACVGKPISIGGYDIIKNEPKPMLKAVPAGSVYYYETEEEPESIFNKIHGQSISDVMQEQGYGVAYVGNFKRPEND